MACGGRLSPPPVNEVDLGIAGRIQVRAGLPPPSLCRSSGAGERAHGHHPPSSASSGPEPPSPHPSGASLLGTPPSDRTPKVREDQTAYALKPTPGANIEDAHLRWSSGGKTKIREDRATQASGRGVINGSHDLHRVGR